MIQGDHLSVPLFILSVENLTVKICDSKLIHGIVVSGQELRIRQYADDFNIVNQNISAECTFDYERFYSYI